jgi:hypothetical protein
MARILLRDLTPGTTYELQFAANSGEITSEWSQKFSLVVSADAVAPSVPLWAAVGAFVPDGTSFIATWQAINPTLPENLDFSHYELELTAASKTVIVKTTGTFYTLTFEENKALWGVPAPSVTARVRAVDMTGNASAYASALVATNAVPGAPTPAAATATASSIAVSWTPTADTDIVRYNVYVGSASNFTPAAGNRIYSGPGDKFNYNTTTYTPLYFKVRAVDIFGQESLDAATGAVTALNPFLVDTTAPAVPTALAATITNNANGVGAQAAVTWTHTAEPDLAGFSLRWKRASDSSWMQVNYPKDARSSTVALAIAYAGYDFQIASYDSSANYSAWSTVLSKPAVANTAPANVGTITLTPSRDSIAASWAAVTDADLAGYEVTISTSSTFASGNTVYTTVGNSFTFSGLAPATQYYVRVRAVDNAGMFSAAYSTTANTTTLSFPLSPLTDGLAPASSPTPTASAGLGFINVQWSPVANADLVTYEVHVSVTNDFTPGPGTKVLETMGTFAILENTAGGTALSYTTDYYVKLVAKDKDASGPASAQAGPVRPNKVSAGDSTITPGDIGAPTTTDFNNLTGTVNTSIKSSVNEYAVNNSETVAPNTGWSTSTPTRTPGTFIWFRTVVTKNDNTTSTTNPALLTGNAGSTGAPGVGIAGTTVTYQTHTNGTTAPTGTWVSTPPATSTGQFLWTRTVTSYTDSSPVTTAYSVSAHGATGSAGSNGVGISGTVVTYQVHTNGTTAPTGTWQSTPQATTTGQFLWTRTVTSYTDSTSTTAYAVSAHGATGSAGSNGISISSVTPYFAQVATGAAAPAKPVVNPPVAPWVSVEPAYVPSTEMYRTERILYSNSTFEYTAVSKVSSYAAVTDLNGYILSRGTDLVTNGTGYLKTNRNFSVYFDANLVDAPSGTSASFYAKSTNALATWIDELIPYDPTKIYKFGWKARQAVAGATNRMYGMLIPYDAYGNAIAPNNTFFTAGSTTTLAAPLNNGDMTITLTNSANWFGRSDKPAGSNTFQRSMIIWNYTDPGGKVWGPETYSRNYWLTDAWADGGVNSTTHVITLRAAWAGGNLAAGTPVSNGSSGGSFVYTPSATNVVVPETWTDYTETFSAGFIKNLAAPGVINAWSWATGLPLGTANIKLGWLLNYAASPTNSIVGRMAIASVSFSDTSAAAKAAADAQISANGKNKITHSTGTPGTTANTLGDTWIQIDNDTDRRIIAQYRGMGTTSWQAETIRSEFIANLDAFKITANSTFTQALNVKSTFTLGDATTPGVIKSYNHNTATKTGFSLSSAGLELWQGTVAANTLVSGTGILNNLIINTGGKITSSVFDSTQGFELSATGLTIRGNSTVAVEAVQGGSITGKTIALAAGGNLNLNGGVIQTDSTAQRGIELKSTGLKAYTSTGVETFSIDSATGNVMIKGGNLTLDSGTFTAPIINVSTGGSITGPGFSLSSTGLSITNAGTTTVDGAIIKTGAVRSNTYVTYGANPAQPVWSIGMDGTAVFSQMSILGNTVIGNGPTDNVTILASSNYVAGSLGWRMNASGEVEFQQVKTNSFNGAAIKANTLSVDALTAGTMKSQYTLTGSLETAKAVTDIDINTTNGSANITTTNGDFFLDDVGVTVVGTGIPVNTTIIQVVLTSPTDKSSKTAVMSANATATGSVAATVSRGRRVTMSSDGVYLKNPDGSFVISLPSDPAFAAEFTGSLTATDLTILDDFRMYGQNNILGQGSKLTLNGGSYKPTTAPEVTFSWDQSGQLKYLDGTNFSPSAEPGDNSGYSYDYISGKWYMSATYWGQYVTKFAGFNDFNPGYKDFPVSLRTSLHHIDDWPVGGVAFSTNFYHFLTRNNSTPTLWKVQGYTRASIDAGGTPAPTDRVSSYTWLNSQDGGIVGNPAFATYNGDTYIAKVITNGSLVLYKYTGFDVSATPAFFTILGKVTGNITTVQVGNFDLGSLHIAVTIAGNTTGGRATYIYGVGASSFTNTANKNHLTPYGTLPYGSVWKAANTDTSTGYFMTLDSIGRIWNHTKLGVGETVLTMTAVQRWRNSVAGQIGAEGPSTGTISYTRRAKMTLASRENIPDLQDGLSPNSLSFYVGVGSSTRYRITDPAVGSKTAVITQFPTTDASGPIASMPTGIPSKILGTNLEINGDGDATFNSIKTVGGMDSAFMPQRMLTGTASITLSNVASNTLTVNFPVGYFTSAPRIMVTSIGTSGAHVYSGVPTTTSVLLGARPVDGGSVTATYTIHWFAVQG